MLDGRQTPPDSSSLGCLAGILGLRNQRQGVEAGDADIGHVVTKEFDQCLVELFNDFAALEFADAIHFHDRILACEGATKDYNFESAIASTAALLLVWADGGLKTQTETTMIKTRTLLAALLLGATSLVTTAAWADYRHRGPSHHHSHHPGWRVGAGLVVGSALLWAATRPPPPQVVYPAPVVLPPPAPVYYGPNSDGWWYYCPTSDTYYPYVQSCPVPWQRVAPR